MEWFIHMACFGWQAGWANMCWKHVVPAWARESTMSFVYSFREVPQNKSFQVGYNFVFYLLNVIL
jgi:hypothetical protein